MIRIVIADKSQITHSGLRSIFSSYEDLCIVGHAHAEYELLDMLNEFETDIVFIDYTSEHELKEFITNKTRVVLGVGLIVSSINLYKDQVCLLGF